MNNSKIALDNEEVLEIPDRSLVLRQQEVKLIKLIEAIERVSHTSDWKLLKDHLFDDLVGSLERRLSQEASKDNIDSAIIYRLQGQITWAKKFSDFRKLADSFRSELSNIRKQLGTEPLNAPDTYEND
jgi:hypothetical protein